jgi:hypothetical protein
MLLKLALNYFIKRLQQEPDYAWSWHCNIAMPIYDTMDEPDGIFANKCAARLMKHLFDVDMTKNEYYIDAIERWANKQD